MIRMSFVNALALIGAAFVLPNFASSADTPDPFIGTWMLNPAKSNCDPPPSPKSHTFRIAKVKGGAFHDTIDLVEGDGTKTHIEFISARDGKYVAVTGSGYADSVSVTQVDPKTFKYTFKKAKKPIESGTFTVSGDGKTLQGTLSGKDAAGAWKCNFVSDRQL
jgi:hypothetical protein